MVGEKQSKNMTTHSPATLLVMHVQPLANTDIYLSKTKLWSRQHTFELIIMVVDARSAVLSISESADPTGIFSHSHL